MGCLGHLMLALLVGVVPYRVGEVRAVSGIYVNNQKIDKFEADRIKLLYPARPTPPDTHQQATAELLTKDNFTSAQHYYQYLIGENPASYIDLLWGRNKTHFPSLIRVPVAPVAAVPQLQHLDDEQSTIKNTLNNSSPAYVGDYHRVQPLSELPVLLPATSTRAPSKRFQKRPKPKPTTPTLSPQVPASPSAELSPETMALLSRYYSLSCTLTPNQRGVSQPLLTATTTATTPTTTRKLKIRRPTSTRKRPARPTTTTTPTTGKRKKPTVYVDPPVINRIGGVLESVYNFMENALTSTEYVATNSKERTRVAESPQPVRGSSGAVKVKRNARNITTAISDILARIGDSSGSAEQLESTRPWVGSTATSSISDITTTTDSSSESSKRFTPDRVTIAGVPVIVSDGNKNKMTTNIQVTSEYTAATPPTVPLPQLSSSDENDSDESDEESEEDYFGGFGGFDDDDEDDDDDEEEEDDDEDGVGQSVGQGLVNDKVYDDDDEDEANAIGGSKGGKKRRRKKRPAVSYEESDYGEDGSDENDSYDDRDDGNDDGDDDEEDEDDEYDSEEAAGDGAEGFFSGLFSSFGRFVRSLGFGGAARGTPETYGDFGEGAEGRSTTPRVLDTRRRPTRSTSNGLERPATQIERDPDVTSHAERSPWLDLPPAYLFNEVPEDGDALEVPVLEAPVPPTPDSPASEAGSGWFDLMMPWDFFNPWSHDAAEEHVQGTAHVTATATPESAVEVPETSTPDSGSSWLTQFFVGAPGPTATTTATPPQKSPRPEQLLSALAQFLAEQTSHASTPRPSLRPKRRKSYAGYQLWRVAVESQEQLQRLVELQRSPEGRPLQWWSGPSLHEPTDVLVPPGATAERLRDALLEDALQYQPTIGDLGRAIAYENPRMTRREQIETEVLHGHPLTWYRYHRYADIVKFVDFLGRRHAQHVRLLHIGRSYEGRPLTVVRVSFAGLPQAAGRKLSVPRKRRPAVFIMAGAHGNQWIGPALATWLLQRLLDASNSSDRRPELETVHAYDWYVLPVANPDGYEYSHEHDRMWSKSRSRPDKRAPPGLGQALLMGALSWWNAQSTIHTEDQPDEECYGVNLDRNWGYRWQDAPGSSRSECSHNYAGPAAFSEPETRAVRDFLLTGRRNVRLFLSLQAYGQSLRYPRAAAADDDASLLRVGAHAFGDVHEMAAVGLEAMRGAGGEMPYTLDRSDGSATAAGYARYAAGIRYSYTLRLPDTGTHGLLLPPSNIVSTGRDTYELIKGMMDYS